MKNLTFITIKKRALKDFSALRNAELKKAKTEWVMFVDSDETVTPELAAEIRQLLTSSHSSFSAYRVKRRDIFLGRQLLHGENGRNRFVRLARRDWGKWHRPVHEVWQGKGRVGELTHPLLHHHHHLKEFLTALNRYSSLEAEYRFRQGKRSSLLHLTFFPPAKFILNYFLWLGFLDGVPGMIMAIMMSWHSFLTWTKLYLLWQKK